MYPSILDGGDARRVIAITGGVDVQPLVDGWTIQNGNATGLIVNCHSHNYKIAGCGGGIFIYQSSPTIQHNIIRDNKAAEYGADDFIGTGGGIFVNESPATLIEWNVIRNNDSHIDGDGWGGGIYIHNSGGDTAIRHNEIDHNEASSTIYKPHSGSGIQIYYNAGQIQIIANYIHDNNPNIETYWGTGIATQYNDNTLIIDNNRITDNSGMSALGLSYSVPTVTRNVIINPGCNTGIDLSGHLELDPLEYAQIINNIIARHDESNVYINADLPNQARAEMIHNTLSDAAYGVYVDSGADVIFDRGIVSYHSKEGIHLEVAAQTELSVSYTLFTLNTDDGITGSFQLAGAAYYIDPAGYDYHHHHVSDAIDRVMDGGIAVDIDGDVRPWGSGTTAFDVGADEFTGLHFFLPLITRP